MRKSLLPVLLFVVVHTACGGDADSEPAPPVSEQPDEERTLEALAETCIAGVLQACDELWNVSPVGSQFELIGATCGNRLDVADGSTFGNCVETVDRLPDVPDASPGSPVPDAPSSIAPRTFEPSELLIDPAPGAWIVISASLSIDAEGSADRALAEADRLRTQHDLKAAVFPSNRFASLNPGFWVIYVDSFGGPEAASARCAELLEQGKLDDCYHRMVSDEPAR